MIELESLVNKFGGFPEDDGKGYSTYPLCMVVGGTTTALPPENRKMQPIYTVESWG